MRLRHVLVFIGSCAAASIGASGCSSSSSTTAGTTDAGGGAGTDGAAGGTGSDGGGGSEAGSGVLVRVIVQADLSQGANGASCTLPARSLLTIGAFGAQGATSSPVTEGDMFNGGSLSATCSVIPSATGFDVKLQALLTGANGGSFTLEGPVTASGGQTGLKTIVAGGTNSFAQLDCTMTYDTNPQMGVAAGRIWGVLTCTKSVDLAASQTCQVAAQVRFEDCAQH